MLMLTLTLTVSTLVVLVTSTDSDTLFKIQTSEDRIETSPSNEKENVLDVSATSSNLIEEPEETDSNVFKSKTPENAYYIYVYIKGVTKSKEDLSVPLKFKIIEKLNNKEASMEDRKVLSPPKVDHKLTSLATSLFTRNRYNLLDTSPLGLGSGILGVGAFDLGHGLGHFGLR
ncbi:uncharacterized protein NPIL_577021 [Nephila pilipes]|uniref:Secreted protein n=1 Tax=Nephila pilipes TaxID=299642 RepID=A0A8X6J4Z5_NEPPI|nr:uncharacterized protein NPIL_577021 [Nephila pilipes]